VFGATEEEVATLRAVHAERRRQVQELATFLADNGDGTGGEVHEDNFTSMIKGLQKMLASSARSGVGHSGECWSDGAATGKSVRARKAVKRIDNAAGEVLRLQKQEVADEKKRKERQVLLELHPSSREAVQALGDHTKETLLAATGKITVRVASSILLRLGIDKCDTTNLESVLACLAAALEKYPLPAAPAPTPAKQSGAAAAPTLRAQSSTAATKAAAAAVPMPPPVVPGSGHANTPILVPGSPKPSRGKRPATSPRRNPSKAEAVTEAAANADAPSKPTRRKVPAKATSRVYIPRPPSSRRGGTSGGH